MVPRTWPEDRCSVTNALTVGTSIPTHLRVGIPTIRQQKRHRAQRKSRGLDQRRRIVEKRAPASDDSVRDSHDMALEEASISFSRPPNCRSPTLLAKNLFRPSLTNHWLVPLVD